jgi:formylglycine-generating enzyme required for sulfatase activity/uncharacterized caspase-like protein
MRFHQIIAAAWLALACAVAPAHAEKRIALVVGNDRYANLPQSQQLQKAVNDAHTVGGALREIGFDVITGENLDRRALVARLDELTRRITPGDTAFFFFSGHGVALDGVNYILPADVPDIAAGQDTRLKREALDEPSIVAELIGRGVRVAVVVLDACRTNPFARPGGKSVGIGKGLAPPPQVQGAFSLYAASGGQEALDRLYDGDPNPNSVFSRVLAPMLKKPGVDLRDLAYEVREEVARIAQTAGHVQRPAYYDETIGGRVYLAGTSTAKEQISRDPPPASDAAQAWGIIQNATSLAVLDDFIRQFGNAPVYGSMARARRDELARDLARDQARDQARPPVKPADGQQVAVVAPAADPCSGPATASSPWQCAPLTATQERGLKPKDSFRECGDCPDMVVLPAGSFTMGSSEREKDHWVWESPQHLVTIRRPFAVGKLDVTVDQFAAFVRETGHDAGAECETREDNVWKMRPSRSWRNPAYQQEGSHPVVCMRWEDAKAYVDWLAKKTQKPYRLLTEAEWEFAARGRTSPGAYPRFWFGDDEKDVCRYGNGRDDQKACNKAYAYTSPAGYYPPNAFGVYDMVGNVWQWTADCWHDTYNGAPADGSAWTSACQDTKQRMIRGGSWCEPQDFLRAAARLQMGGKNSCLGFRVARTLTP